MNKTPELRETAYHEAGHAVTAVVLGWRLFGATTIAFEESLGHTVCHEEDYAAATVEDQVAFCLAGYIAEARHGRLNRAARAALYASLGDTHEIIRLGLTDQQFYVAARRAYEIVYSNWEAVKKVANILVHKRRVRGFVVKRRVINQRARQ